MTKKFYLAFLLVFCGAILAFGQSLERRSGELLLKLNPEASPNSVLFQLNAAIPGSTPMTLEPLVTDWQLYRLRFDESTTDPAALLTVAQRQIDIRVAQWNRRVLERSTQPNDPEWMMQDDMELIGLPEAWDVTTGGVTADGDTIVVAVLEKGALLEHPDLAPNIWYNWGEIPGNELDDDGNGYTDDFRGWNPRTGNDDPGTIGFHGTSVNGIIGAKGNNNEGVTGVNWNIKMMNLANTEFESEIIAAYKYVADMRKLYNTTNGAKGAFVVATNASFGLDNEWGIDFPLWCAAYDSLGAVGVLSMGATANRDVNVDIQGDMPSTCPSEYLIVVANVDKFDKKRTNSAYGPMYVDLGAPGDDAYTTSSQGMTAQYAAFSGTSAATPHVTGAVGLLYSLDCSELTADALTAPALCARRVRDIILENVSPNTTFENITVTGGRLDVSASVKAVQELCDGATAGPLEILWVRPNPVRTELEMRFQTPNYIPYQIRVFNMLGQQLHEETVTPSPFSSNIWKFDAHALPAGVYAVAFGRKDAWRSAKFVKY